METQSTPTEAVAANVSRLLREANITQRDAALATGIPLTTLVRRLTGKTPLLVTELGAIAELLGVPLTVLVATDTTSGNIQGNVNVRGNRTNGAA